MNKEEVQYRWLGKSDLVRLAEIDRAEQILLAYSQEGDELTPKTVNWQVPTWTAQGDGDHSLNQIVAFCSDHLERGGLMRGAFVDDILVGVGILQPDIRPYLDQLAFLQVSRDYRRQGIASELVDDLCRTALDKGSKRLYVSATPSESAVKFYAHHGFKPVKVRVPELQALEPEDIHMIKEL